MYVALFPYQTFALFVRELEIIELDSAPDTWLFIYIPLKNQPSPLEPSELGPYFCSRLKFL